MAYPLLSLNFYSCANGTLTMDKEGEGEGQMISCGKKKRTTVIKFTDIKVSCSLVSKTMDGV